MKAFLDFIPLLAFFIAAKKYDLVVAAGAVLVSSLLVFCYHFITQKFKLTKQQVVILVLTIIFCGLTLILRDDYWIRLKFSVIYGVLALALFISLLFNQLWLKKAGQKMLDLTDIQWKKVTISWILFFTILSAVNYYLGIILNISDSAYANFKFIGVTSAQLIFMFAQLYIFRKQLILEEEN